MRPEEASDQGDPPLPADFGGLIRTLRRRQGYTQEQLAQRAFTSARKSTISELENDPSRVVHPATLVSLADALELSPRERSLFAAAAERRTVKGADVEPIKPALVRRHRWLTTRGGIGSMVVLFVGCSAALIVAVTGRAEQGTPLPDDIASEASTSATARISVDAVQIDSPLNGEMVDSPLTVQGTVLPSTEETLWLVLKPLTDTTYYVTTPEPISVDSTGAWSSHLRLGRGPQDVGYEYDLFAVLSPAGGIIERETAIKPAGQWGAHLAELPADSIVAERLQITLGRYTG